MFQGLGLIFGFKKGVLSFSIPHFMMSDRSALKQLQEEDDR